MKINVLKLFKYILITFSNLLGIYIVFLLVNWAKNTYQSKPL